MIQHRNKLRYFHWSSHGSLVSTGQNFVTTRVVHLPKRTETSLITESDRGDLIAASDQAVRAVHTCSCKSWLEIYYSLVGWLVVFGLNGPLRQYFSLYRAVSSREREKEKRNYR